MTPKKLLGIDRILNLKKQRLSFDLYALHAQLQVKLSFIQKMLSYEAEYDEFKNLNERVSPFLNLNLNNFLVRIYELVAKVELEAIDIRSKIILLNQDIQVLDAKLNAIQKMISRENSAIELLKSNAEQQTLNDMSIRYIDKDIM